MKILITGITGLIGKHLMGVLLENKYTDNRGHHFTNRNMEEYKNNLWGK